MDRIPATRESPGQGSPRRTRAAGRPLSPPSAIDAPRLRPRRGPNRWVGRVLVFATCVLLLDALVGDRGLAERMRAGRDYDRAAGQLSLLQQKNAGLREQIRRLQEDASAIEAVARRELGLIRPGEILFVLRDVK